MPTPEALEKIARNLDQIREGELFQPFLKREQ